MSEANIGFTLAPNNLTDTKYVDSSVSQPRRCEETDADYSRDPQNEIPRTTTPITWEDALRQLGREFAEIRQAQGISVYQLHAQTLVPLHILKELESGDLTRFPAKIYVKGFIHRIGDALGLDGVKLAASLPADNSPNASSEVKRVRYFRQFYLNRFHLYLGYIALLIAAVSCLSWISNPTSEESSAERTTDTVLESETSRPQKQSVPENNP